jgi:YVTN family beta-propeller protein
VYLLDRGKPSNNPDKNVNGRLHAVSMTSRAVHGVADVGSRPRGLVLDERGRQLLLLSDGTPVKGPANKDRQGELRAIRDGGPGAAIPVTTSPERLEASQDGTILYALGLQGLTRLTLPGLVPSASIKASGIGGNETVLASDGRRAYVLFGEYFSTYDIEKGEEIAGIRTGRMGKKMFLAFEGAVKTEASKSEGRREAENAGRSHYRYTEYTVRPPSGTLAIRPDGKAVYALNSQTSDVTVVDADTGQVLEKVAAGGFAVRFMAPASLALVVSASKIQAVDFASHQKLPDIVASSAAAFDQAHVSPDGRLALVHGPGGLVIVNASSGKAVGTATPFKRIADVAVEWGHAR